MEIVFYLFALVLVWLSFKSFRGGVEYLEFFRQEIDRDPQYRVPFASVFVPCKGLDHDLEENLSAVLDQDHADFEVIFVADNEADPAVTVIRTTIEGDDRARLVIAPKARTNSQKAENLREAVLHSAPTSETFVFADSDARPARDWLRSLCAPLADDRIGATTGYRWFISGRPTLASELLSAWNASIASALGPRKQSNFCWGGSMAIRRRDFDRLDIRERWRTALSDDFAVTRAVKDAGLLIAFVPKALAASFGEWTLSEMLEFTTRQMKITRACAPPLWLMSLFGSSLFCGVMLAALSIVVFRDRNDIVVMSALATIFLVTIFSVGKAWLRLKAVRLVLTTYDVHLRRQLFAQNTLWMVTPLVFLFNSLAALFSRRIVWRGTAYKLKSATETVIIAD